MEIRLANVNDCEAILHIFAEAKGKTVILIKKVQWKIFITRTVMCYVMTKR